MAAKKPQSKPKSKRGGRRPGAGRKTKAANKLRSELVAECEKLICDHLPRLIANMIALADGGYERVEEKWEPVPFTPPGQEPELVLVERKVSIADRDRAANQYLIDRMLGKPKERHEQQHEGQLEVVVRYADADSGTGPSQAPSGPTPHP